MKFRATAVWTLFCLVVSLGAVTVTAGDRDAVDVWGLAPPEKSPLFDPAFYVAAGFDYRAGGNNSLTTSPSVVADLLFQFNRVAGLKATLDLVPDTLADPDLTGRGSRHQTRRQVHGITHHRVLAPVAAG